MKVILLLLALISFLFTACNDGKKGPDVSHIKVEFQLIPFYKALQAIPADSVEDYIPLLQDRYGNYLTAISEGVLRIGSPKDALYAEHLKSFLEYDANQDVFRKIDSTFADLEPIQKELESAFAHYNYYFPDRAVPDVYFHISGFNQSIVVDSNWVSVSLEKYLGADCEFYEWLEIFNYLRRRMVPEKIVPDVMKAMAFTEYPYQPEKNNLLNNMIYQGKILYFVSQMCPQLQDTLLLDLSEDELTWCTDYESDVWGYMVENKHLFSTDRMVTQKYTGDSPFTSYLGQESPGKTGIYIGYHIIATFMKNNPSVNLRDLMSMSKGQEILAASKYSP